MIDRVMVSELTRGRLPARRLRQQSPMDPVRQNVFDALSRIPKGTLIFVDYVPAGARDAEATKLAAASQAAGLAPTHYVGKFSKVDVVGGDPVFYMHVENRRGKLRCFNPFKGKLRAIQPIQVAA